MSHHGLRRAASDIFTWLDKHTGEQDLITEKTIAGVDKAECECCGIIEDCTPDYIEHVRDSHCGKWICGLCSEAVKERIAKAPTTTIEGAICSLAELCTKFNRTTRLDPKLSLALSMRDIAKKTSQQRNSKNISRPRITRRHSCCAKIHLD